MSITILADVLDCYLQYRLTALNLIISLEMAAGIGLLSVCVYWIWFVEAFTRITPPTWLRWVLRMPAIVCIGCILLSPLGHGVYWQSAPGTFERGPLYFVKPLTYTFYIVLQFIMLTLAAASAKNPDIRKEYISFSMVGAFPVIGSFLQYFAGSAIPITNPSFALALLYGYIAISSRKSGIDFLTGLYNRSIMDKVSGELLSSQALQSSPEDEKAYYFYMMDLNNFKAINDRFGHSEGDRALILTGSVLFDLLDGCKGCFCRYGGDEFAALVYDTEENTQKICDEIRSRVRALRFQYKLKYNMSISIGVTRVSAKSEEDLKQAFRTADSAMYEEKLRTKSGRDMSGEEFQLKEAEV